MDQQKVELLKKHTRDIQDLLEDTSLSFAKLESDHNAQPQATDKKIQQLELRVKQQAVEIEKSNTEHQEVTQAKAPLENQIASITAELQEAKRRTVSLQKEKEQLSEQHNPNIQRLCVEAQRDLSHLQQEQALSSAKASEEMEEFKKTVALLDQQVQEIDYLRQQEVRDQEMNFLQEKNEYLMRYVKKMEKVEEDLNCSKSLREKQAKEFSQQLDDLRHKYKQQIAEQRTQHEQEKTQLQQQHTAEKDSLVQKHLQEVSGLEMRARVAQQQHQQHSEKWKKHFAQVIMLHQDYQEQIKGLMPADVTQDLEDTITSLKAQIDFNEKPASVLQEELDVTAGGSHQQAAASP